MAASGEDCTDGVDNNNNGLVDCADPRCFTGACVEDCSDGVDNDGDSVVDCDDPDCFWGDWADRPREEWEVCWADCALEDASWPHVQNPELPFCEGLPSAEDCFDTFDNDWDRLVDGEDPDCEALPRVENCYDSEDNDSDGRVDCEDGDCAEQCQEICDDGLDNDNNLVADCDDLACVGFYGCQELTVEAAVILGGKQHLLYTHYDRYSSTRGYQESQAWTLQSMAGTLQAGPLTCRFDAQSVSWSTPPSIGAKETIGHTKLTLSSDCPMPSVYWRSPSLGETEGLSEIRTEHVFDGGDQRVDMLWGPGRALPGKVWGRLIFPPITEE
ncbi:MAG: hypothetical protein ACI9VR_004206 [Cognaticolwellia sp.]|jgi:hypothetical protein